MTTLDALWRGLKSGRITFYCTMVLLLMLSGCGADDGSGAAVGIAGNELVSLELTPTVTELPLSGEQALTVTATLSDGTSVVLTEGVQWHVGSEAVATVLADGRLQGVGPGATTVTVTHESSGLQDTTLISVLGAGLADLRVTAESGSLALGIPLQLHALGILEDGSTIDVSGAVNWDISDGLLAGISTGGTLLGLSTGVVAVVAVDPTSGLQASLNVELTDAVLVSLRVLLDKLQLPLGLSQTLRAVGTFSDGSTQDVTGLVNWSNDSPSIVGISPAGVLTALGLGNANVTATDATGQVSASHAVQISSAVLQSISLDPGTLTVLLGLLQPLKAMGHFSDGSTADLTNAVNWSSDNPLIAAVNDAGQTLGLLVGNTVIRAHHAASGHSATAGVSVAAAALESIAVVLEQTALPLGLSQTLRAVGTYTDGSTQDISDSVSWSTDNAEVAQIGLAGRLTGAGLGLTNATAHLPGSGVSGSRGVEITAAVLQSLSIEPNSISLLLGALKPLQAMGTYSDGSSIDMTESVVWTSDNPLIATVNHAGRLLSLLLGNTVVHATHVASGNSVASPVGITLF